MSNTFTAQELADFYQKVADGGESQTKIDGEFSNLFVGGPSLGSSKDVWRIKPTKKVAKTLEQLEKELTEAYKDNEDCYSRGYGQIYRSKIQELEDEIAALMNPAKKVIDLSVLIETGIDVELGDFQGVFFLGGHLTHIIEKGSSSMYNASDSTNAHSYARPRMNHKHAWLHNNCPIEGFVVRAWVDKEDFLTVHTSSNSIDWSKIMYVEFLEVEHGYVMPWEQDL